MTQTTLQIKSAQDIKIFYLNASAEDQADLLKDYPHDSLSEMLEEEWQEIADFYTLTWDEKKTNGTLRTPNTADGTD
jgi:hypothetical protein